MNKKDGIEFLRGELENLEAEYQKKRTALLAALDVVSDGAPIQRIVPSPAPAIQQSRSVPRMVYPPMSVVLMEFANKTSGDFTKVEVEDHIKAIYPGLTQKVAPRAIATGLVKLAMKGKLIRVQIGENGQPSIYRRK